MNLIKYLISYFQPRVFTGVLKDTRSSLEKESDVTHDEFIAGGAVEWITKETVKKFPARNQASSLSCVMQSSAKARGVTFSNNGQNFPILSAREYNERTNYPEPGTIPYEGLKITTRGLALESFYPSQEMSETAINQRITKNANVIHSEKQYAGGVPVKLPIDIDVIAQMVDAGYGVVICLNFAGAEYARAIPITLRGVYRGVDHQIAVVDRSLVDGQKALICEDSAFLASIDDGQRIITEEFLLNHCYFVGYVRDTIPLTPNAVPKPIHTFTMDLQIGMRGNEVLLLQKRLVFEGYLSSDCMTGYFGNLTRLAVISYQDDHKLSTTGYVGPLTRNTLNK